MVFLGIFLLICSVISFCCAFQLKFVQKAVGPEGQSQPLNPQQPPQQAPYPYQSMPGSYPPPSYKE
ncbi:unnamed protein product [Hymenolepis diminuta]|uniref:Uncharacterized protein n=1 Tax=Hymenolepis diminuta TaxID=6216 RepID=A0A564Z2Y0_HYMDI|nr:unnamed protein product [Hymenolepis diminuta]